MEWKTIDSAPKDGTSILVWDDVDEEVYGVWWNNGWQIAPNIFVPDATYWMMPPLSPQAQEE